MNSYVILLGFGGPQEWILIIIALLLLFGGRKIPELMKGLGQGMKEFKKARNVDENGKTDGDKKDEAIDDSSK